MKVSKRDARKLFLKQQGLLRDAEFGRGKNAVFAAVKRLSYVQIDTISVINRAHEHALATRVENFKPKMLDKLHDDRQLFEYWSHAAAYIPFEHYRHYTHVMKGFGESRNWDRKMGDAILERIAAEGPLSSKDFEDTRDNKQSGWWDWKPAKQVLEHLFLSGQLMIARREGFQKVYDLPERVIPDHVDTSPPSIEEWSDHLVSSMMNALGVATEYDLSYARATIRRLSKIELKKPIRETINNKIESGEFVEIEVDGNPYLTTNSLLEQLPIRVTKKRARFLSPFDNAVINRRRNQQLFDFDYMLECYLPAEKRQYGYFCLPILLGDEIIGRMDAKADRSKGELIVRNLVLEPSVRVKDETVNAIADGIKVLAEQHDSRSIVIERCDPKSIIQPLRDLTGTDS